MSSELIALFANTLFQLVISYDALAFFLMCEFYISVFVSLQAFIAKLEAEKAEIANIVNKTRDELTAAKETAHTLQRQAIDVSISAYLSSFHDLSLQS